MHHGLPMIPVAPFILQPEVLRDSYFKVDLQQAYSPSAFGSQDTRYDFKIKQKDKH